MCDSLQTRSASLDQILIEMFPRPLPTRALTLRTNFSASRCICYGCRVLGFKVMTFHTPEPGFEPSPDAA
jgi:hypothetical protein